MKTTMSFCFIASAAYAEVVSKHGAPMLELISMLQHHHQNRMDVHHQVDSLARRRQLQSEPEPMDGGALTRENTKPIRVKLDVESLYAANAPEYSACFTVGAWFRRGLPAQQTPPPNGVETCVRGTGESLSHDGCWGKCKDYDLITDADRDALIQVATALVSDLPVHFALRPVDNLKFTVSKGAYERALRSKGYPTPTACATDCNTLSRVAVNDGYCEETGGLASGYDAVLSITKPPGVAGIAGTGSACASDQKGRPLWMVVAWHQSIVGMSAIPVADSVAQHRGFFRHEALHGMGFINSFFNYARDSRGFRKRLIEMRPVVDTDGATDEVWHFVRGRAYELAQKYFNCDGNATADAATRAWDGLPLMGLPEAGRGAHWETRIMRDDVMSYGFREAVSSITLAAMEDLGFYLANYSSADCMSWGYMQGCGYVRSRCGLGIHDQSAVLSSASASKCRGEGFWRSYPDPYLAQKCAEGNDPCSTQAASGYDAAAALPDGSTAPVCDAQCASDGGVREGCSTAPTAEVEGALQDVLDDFASGLSSVQWEAWLIPAVWLSALCCLGSVVRKCFCPRSKHCMYIAYACSLVVLLCGVAYIGVAAYMFVEYATFNLYIGPATLVGIVCVGAAHVIFAVAIIVALCVHSPCGLYLGFYWMLILAVVEIVLTLLVVYWVYSIGDVPTDALGALLGDAHSSVDNFLSSALSQPVAVAEGLVCKTYQKCCRDFKLALIEMSSNATSNAVSGVDETGEELGSGGGAVGSGEYVLDPYSHGGTTTGNASASSHCLAPAQHEGAATDFELTLRDPSTENFCPYTSGAHPALLIDPPAATCFLIEEAAGGRFSLDQCKQDFCQTGIDGYLTFLALAVDIIQRYGVYIGCAIALLVVMQLIMAFNLRHAAQLDQKRKSVNRHKKNNEVDLHPVYTSKI